MIFDDVSESAKQIVLRASIQRLLDDAKGIDTGIIVPYVRVSADHGSYEHWSAYDLWMRKETPPVDFFRCNGIPSPSGALGGTCNRSERSRAIVLFIRQAIEPFARTLASQNWYPESWTYARQVEPLVGALHVAANGVVVRFGYDPDTRSYVPHPLEGDPIDAFLDEMNSAEGNRDWMFFKYANPTQGMCEAMQWPTVRREETYSDVLIDICSRLGRFAPSVPRFVIYGAKMKPAIDSAMADIQAALLQTGEDRRRKGRIALLRLTSSYRGFYFFNKHGKQFPYSKSDRWWQEFYRIAADSDGPDNSLIAVKVWLMEQGIRDRWPEILVNNGDTA